MAKKPKLEIFTSYLKTIENSVDSNIFRNLYYKIGRKTIDVLDNGDLSCANYVTTILYILIRLKIGTRRLSVPLMTCQNQDGIKLRNQRKERLSSGVIRKKMMVRRGSIVTSVFI